ncbi:MAG: trimethylamine methyltransferase family protein [Gammaproteobacteria bacterium]|nr:trimethylamine methyltransferase family protein [Gammaproteobacteria bacterium]
MSRRSTLRARRRQTAGAGLRQSPFCRYENPYPPFEILSADHVEAIHEASLEILKSIGINFLLDEARRVLKAAGADIDPDSTRVRFERGLILDAVSKAPSAFGISARNPEHSLHFGGRSINFAAVSSPPNASDLERGRRSGNFQDFCDFLKLTQSVNVAQIVSGHAVEPVDIDTSIRHLVATRAMIEFTDKIFRLYSLGRQRVLDVLEMAKIARGFDDDQLARDPSVFTMVNSNSPLQYDVPMLWGMIELALRNQPVVVTPFTLAGAMAPVTLAGALAQQNAEALAGMAFCQIVNPGAPVMYGGFTSNVDMKSGAPAFGTPEYAKATLIGGQLARRYGVPYRSSNVNASNAPDAQAAYESQMALWSSVLGHAHMIHHGLGWLEGGLCASFEKFIIDTEMVQMMTELLKPVEVNPDTLALDAIREVGPGGHFFGAAHTLERYETAFYPPMLSDWRNFESWNEAGAEDATRRAHRIFKSMLAQYEPPPLEDSVREALNVFVEKRIVEGGAPVN